MIINFTYFVSSKMIYWTFECSFTTYVDCDIFNFTCKMGPRFIQWQCRLRQPPVFCKSLKNNGLHKHCFINHHMYIWPWQSTASFRYLAKYSIFFENFKRSYSFWLTNSRILITLFYLLDLTYKGPLFHKQKPYNFLFVLKLAKNVKNSMLWSMMWWMWISCIINYRVWENTVIHT